MNGYEKFGRYWTAIQMAHKTGTNSSWIIAGTMIPPFQDKAFMARLREARDNLQVVVELIDSLLEDQN